ncbi:unnamed protein product [Mycena citricolor]|uniref:Uncharacterized protein n=1 Tax=Mycena citricolor TaxID=2018698 RepID=A0AAD2HV09_9AGAR|nr:unnamed protein product [Mycena citricolor]
MPLFKSHPAGPDPVVAAAVSHPPRKGGGFFSRQRSPTPEPIAHQPAPSRGFFARRRSSEDSSLGGRSSGSDHLARTASLRTSNSRATGRKPFDVHKDPTIIAAKEKVVTAEKAEAAADAALNQARAMVREAKDHVRFLEREAAEEQKRARAKQAIANDVSKSARGLGRHGP